MSSNTESRAALITRASQVLNTKPFTPECSALFDRLIKLSSEVMSENRATVSESEQRAAKHEGAFRKYLRGDDSEIRTALSTAGVPIPQSFAAAYGEALKSFSGIREAGANVITSTNGDSLKNPFSTDTGVGERLNENDPVSLSNPIWSGSSFGAFRYSSKGLQYSAQLLDDAGIDIGQYLSRTLSRRIGRLTNSEFTNGGGGSGPVGVIPSLTQIVTSEVAGAISINDLLELQTAIGDSGYLPGSVYMFHPNTEKFLKKLTTTDGFHSLALEMSTNRTIFGYRYILNPAMTSTLSGTVNSVVFGNFKLGVTIREVVPSLLISKERYAEYRMLYAAMRHDQDCQVVDASALAVLQGHA
jgi:HK97 family phage major capsid protein